LTRDGFHGFRRDIAVADSGAERDAADDHAEREYGERND
jgi:hypothetical protein